ncbi:MAG: DNA polymerase III subunit delta [Anaerolineae bacterium]
MPERQSQEPTPERGYYYIFYGDDEFSRAEALAEMKRILGDTATAGLNTVTFEGNTVTLEELTFACQTVPLLGERRLVVVEGLLTRLQPRRDKKGGKEKPSRTETEFVEGLRNLLQRLPATTRLVFLEKRDLKRGKSPFLELVKTDRYGFEKEFDSRKEELVDWIERRTGEKGGEIEEEAAQELAAFVGTDKRLLDQEIEKLVIYVGGTRPISGKDVRLLVSYAQEANIFHMVDALGQRRRRLALTMLHRLLEDGEAPIYLLYMITRQFRMMLQAKEMNQGGASVAQVQRMLGGPRFVAEKVLAQARNFTFEQLESAHRRLLVADTEIKTGRTDPVLTLDLLLFDLAR